MVELNWAYNNLTVNIPDDIKKLRYLKRLYIAYKNLSVTLPESISELNRLIRLNWANKIQDIDENSISSDIEYTKKQTYGYFHWIFFFSSISYDRQTQI